MYVATHEQVGWPSIILQMEFGPHGDGSQGLSGGISKAKEN